MDRKAAAGLARAVPGIDVLVVALGAQAPEPKDVRATAETVGATVLVIPANRGQVVSRLALTLRAGGGALVDAVGPAAAVDRQPDEGLQDARPEEDAGVGDGGGDARVLGAVDLLRDRPRQREAGDQQAHQEEPRERRRQRPRGMQEPRKPRERDAEERLRQREEALEERVGDRDRERRDGEHDGRAVREQHERERAQREPRAHR